MWNMPFMLSPQWFALKSDRRHQPRARDRRQIRLPLTVTPLEERQLLTTPTLISVSSSASNLTFGQSEVFQATVVANPPGGTSPTGGTVTFNDGTTVLGTAALVNGAASLSIPTLAAGTYSVTATYSGTATYGGSSSTTSAAYIFDQAGTGTYGNTVSIAGQAASAAELANPFGAAVAPNGTIYIADTFNNEIDYVNPNTGIIKVLAGNGTYGDVDGPALSAEFADPRGLALDVPLNLLFIADRDNNTIRELNLATGMVSTVAGTGTFGNGGSDIPATSAALASPTAVAVGPSGLNLYIADTFNNEVREVNLTTGIITTIAGTGTAGFAGDGGPATSAELYDPSGLAVASGGNVFISDSDNEVVREVTASTGIINTIAGTPQTLGDSGDNGPAKSAELATPYGLALNSAGTLLYVADRDNNAIREVNLTTGIITTIAGNGAFGPTGNGGPATAAALSSPRSVAVDAAGDVFIADTLGNEIRMVVGGQGTAAVTVTPFAAIAPGRTTVFSTGVPTGVGKKTAQGIVLALNAVTNTTAASREANYILTTLPNRAGKVKRINLNRVRFVATTDVVSLFPRTRLSAHGTYQLVIRGQAVGRVTIVFNKQGIVSESV
jgi:hypothetical protein